MVAVWSWLDDFECFWKARNIIKGTPPFFKTFMAGCKNDVDYMNEILEVGLFKWVVNGENPDPTCFNWWQHLQDECTLVSVLISSEML